MRSCFYYFVGDEGFEPPEWRDQNPLPYRLANPQRKFKSKKLQSL